MPRKIPVATKMVNKIAQKKANPSKRLVATTKALGKGLEKAVSPKPAKPAGTDAKPEKLTTWKMIKGMRETAAFTEAHGGTNYYGKKLKPKKGK